MAIEPIVLQGFSQGIDNRSARTHLGEGFVRDLVNLDPGPSLVSRVGYEKVADMTHCRALIAYRSFFVAADGEELLRVSRDGTKEVIALIAGAGPVAHCIHNDELFISTATACLRYDGDRVRPWGVPDVVSHPSPSVGTAPPGTTGRQLFAMTYVNEFGEEGGTVRPGSAPAGPMTFQVDHIPAGCSARIYVSPPNATTLYLQGELDAPGELLVARVSDDTAPLTTVGKGAPLPGALMASRGGSVFVAQGPAIYYTDPMSPHLVEYDRHFFQYPRDVGVLLSGMHGLYVGADKSYRITSEFTDTPSQRVMELEPPLPGSGAVLPTGEAVWLTRYGMRRESADPREGVGGASSDRFYLGEHQSAAVGVVEHDGRRSLVATTQPAPSQGGLAAADYFEAEVIRP